VSWIGQIGLIGLLTWGSPGYAQESAAPNSGRVEDGRNNAQEIQAIKDIALRYGDRMREFEAEARHLVDLQEAEERKQVNRNYSALIEKADDSANKLRNNTISEFEEFLQKYPKSTHSAHVMFRLAELYFEKSEEEYLVADAEFRKALEVLADDGEPPEQPRKDFRRSVALYERIVRDYPEYTYADGAQYMMGYCHSDPDSAIFDEEKGLAFFQAIIEKYPKSRFLSSAYLRVGEYNFDYGNLEKAQAAYKRVIEIEGREGKLYDEALYKLAWSEYRETRYDSALKLLDELLVWSETVNMQRTGKESAMAPEAIEYTAISFSDLADNQQKNPVSLAQDFYSRLGGRPYEDKVYKRLADVLTQQARYEDAIRTYEFIQTRWPNDAKNPDYQWQIASLYMTMSPPQPEKAQAAVAALTDKYNEGSPWWKANYNNPDAQAVARRYVESSLSSVAAQFYIRAQDTKDPADFLKAAEYYTIYLNKFPFAADYYEILWYRGNAFKDAGAYEKAESDFVQLMKAGEHNYKEGALWETQNIRRRRLSERMAGNFDQRPADAVVESTAKLPSGTERQIYKLSPDQAAFIEVADQLVKSDFSQAVARIEAQIARASKPEEKERLTRDLETMKAYAAGLEQFRKALAYIPAQMLHHLGRYEESRPRLSAVIDQHCATAEGSYSARLLVDSYTLEEDLQSVRKLTEKFLRMPCMGDTNEGTFSDLRERATFELASKLSTDGKFVEAAAAFQEFLKEFPKSSYRKNALYNVANNLEAGGKLADANAVFEEYVQKYPDDEKSVRLFFRLGGNYAQALELDRAITYYEQLYNRTKGKGIDHPDAANALYNAAFLMVGTGDYARAAKAYERYGKENSELADAERVYFMAGEQWERVNAQEGIRFYKRYLEAYPSANPDHIMEAYHQIASLTEKSGKPAEIDRAWDDLNSAYQRLAPSGKVSPIGRHHAAFAELRHYLDDIEKFKQIKFGTNDVKNAELLKAKLDELGTLEARAGQLINTYQDFETTSGILYGLGTAYFSYADMLFQAPEPKGVSEELLDEYRLILSEKRIPLEDKGRARLELVLNNARDQKIWTEWQTRALETLATIAPTEFANEKQELRGSSESRQAAGLGPVPVREAPATEKKAP
jgi:cellulose synthase operon protein C